VNSEWIADERGKEMVMNSQLSLNPLWDFVFATILFGATYLYYTENKRQRSVSRIRQFLFYTAIVFMFIILVGPLAHAAVNTFWIHMVQHISLMMLISPLIVLGSPGKLLLGSTRPRLSKVVHAISHNRVFRQLFRAEVGFVIFLSILIATHFSPLADAGMMNSNMHVLELWLFIIGGVIYYYPVMEGNPQPYPTPYFKRVLSLFAMMLPETMVGFFLYSGNRLLHSLPTSMNMGSAISDQHKGGAIMWALGMLIDAMWIVLATRDWFENEKNKSGDGDDWK
jgi:putative copper resistance protein D